MALAGCKPNSAPVAPSVPVKASIKPEVKAFTLPTPTGEQISLTEQLATHKAVLINFWFNECSGCKEEFPQLQKLYKDYKDKGFTIVAINTDNDPTAITDYLHKGRFAFPVAVGKGTNIIEDYKVGLFPTNILLDKNGKVILRLFGYDNKQLRTEIEKLLAAS